VSKKLRNIRPTKYELDGRHTEKNNSTNKLEVENFRIYGWE
jgi:hypothetical protein